MAITRIKNSTIGNKTPKYNDVLAGLPFIPIIGTASDGGNGTSASVAFTGNNVANGTITYTALSSPGSFTGTGTASPITVSGLTAGTAYTFQVKAGNSLGDSAYSAASNSVTPVTPTSFDSIASATPTGTGTVTFSSIPSTYQHLQIRYSIITTSGQAVGIRLNGDSSTIYTAHGVEGSGASVFAAGLTAQNQSYIVGAINNGTVDTYANVGIIDLHDYASTTKNKTTRTFVGGNKNSTTGEYVALCSGLYQSTSAISSLSIICTANYLTGTTFSLYGIRG